MLWELKDSIYLELGRAAHKISESLGVEVSVRADFKPGISFGSYHGNSTAAVRIELGGPMSKQAIQKAVVEQLRQSQRPMSVRELVERIRRDRLEFKQVADFDFRSAVLAMRTSGAIESTSTNQVAVRTDQPVPARG